MAKIRVAVLMGGKSAEREVSLSTGRQVMSALDPEKYEAFPVDTALLGKPALSSGTASDALAEAGTAPSAEAAVEAAAESPAAATESALQPAGERLLSGPGRPDVALICLHGRFGEDGTVQGMLELLEIPYTGSRVLASALAMNKVMAKKVMMAEGIPMPPSVTVRGRAEAHAYLQALEAGTAPVTCPAVVKPSEQGSTIGITIVQDPADMPTALEKALELDNEVLIEKFVQGIEITGPVLGNDELTPLPLVEIVPSSGFYDFAAKYTPGATDEIVPARLLPEQTRLAQELAMRSHRALGCRGFSRTDMIVAEDGIWVLEVNTIPGMTPTSLLPRSAAAAGISFPELVDRMIALALEGQ